MNFNINLHKFVTFIFILILTTSSDSLSKEVNIDRSITAIENFLNHDTIEINTPKGIRSKEDKAKWTFIKTANGDFMRVKIKVASRGGSSPNNEPRYELAAYKFQQFFLDSSEYVVPPSVIRPFSIDQYKKYDPRVKPTFKRTNAVICLLQYWLQNVSTKNVLDLERFEMDSLYAKHFANLNLFTYLIRHSDSNEGNFLISTIPDNPRIFSVDNGLAFGDHYSKLGFKFRKLIVKQFPKTTVDRLKQLSYSELVEALSVVAQFKISEGNLIAVPPTKPINVNKGVRRSADIIQFGLTQHEIHDIWLRLESLLKQFNTNKLQTF